MRLEDALAEHGVDLDRAPEATARLRDVRAYLELHIEQGPCSKVCRPARRDGARDGRGGAQPRDLPRAGCARRLDADDPPSRLVPRGRAFRARRARCRRAPRRHEHDRGCRLAAGRRDCDRGGDGAAARSAAPRCGRAGRPAGRVAHACRGGRCNRALHGRVGADLAHRPDPVRRRADRRGPRMPVRTSQAPITRCRRARCTTPRRWRGTCRRS